MLLGGVLENLQSHLRAFDENYRKKGFKRVVGVDEAGRGPLAGPVVACSLFFHKECDIDGINDSKKLTPKKRELIYDKIINNPDITYSIGVIGHHQIDQVNILRATILAMTEALNNLTIIPDCILFDGLSFMYKDAFVDKIIKGDALSLSIAAASIMAKVHRDRLMQDYHQKWPQYGFNKHKGYGTKFHRAKLKELGPCKIHRKSFEPIKLDVMHLKAA